MPEYVEAVRDDRAPSLAREVVRLWTDDRRVLPESRLWTSVTVPVLNRPPATRPDALPETVLLVSVTVPLLSTPPPRSAAVLPETVLLVSVKRVAVAHAAATGTRRIA